MLLHEPEIRFDRELRIPDLAGWQAERFDGPEIGPMLVSPDWICEVLSPSTARWDRAEKMPLYAAHGVRWLWLLDPVARTLEVYRRQESLWLALGTHAGDDRVAAEPFDAVAIDLGSVWRLPGKP